MRTARRKNVVRLEKAIETALDDGNFISYKAAWAFVDGLQHVAKQVGELTQANRTEPRGFSQCLFRRPIHGLDQSQPGAGREPAAIGEFSSISGH